MTTTLPQLPPRTLAIDPGETCGYAVVHEPGHIYAGSYPMLEFLSWVDNALWAHNLDRIVIEEYRIYPDKALAHSGKTVPTAECIGAVKWIARRYGVPVIEQQASIKQPTAGMLRHRGYQYHGKNRHAKDAELHLWHYAWRNSQHNPNT